MWQLYKIISKPLVIGGPAFQLQACALFFVADGLHIGMFVEVGDNAAPVERDQDLTLYIVGEDAAADQSDQLGDPAVSLADRVTELSSTCG